MARLFLLARAAAAVALLAPVQAATMEEASSRDLLGFTYTNNKDQTMGASLSTGCYDMGNMGGGKLKVMVCFDKKGVAALQASQRTYRYMGMSGQEGWECV